MLVHIKELFKGSVVGQFAYPAFNTQNLETTIGIIQAAEDLSVPVILAVSEGTIAYAGLDTIFEIMATHAVHAKVPIALHMDHGKDMEQLMRGIELGYSSVMIDHSKLSLEENIRDTKSMVEFAHAEGAWVQGEVGRIRGTEDWMSVSDTESLLTTPEDAKKFVVETGVDTLACAVGTVHGIIKLNGLVKPVVDIPRIQAISHATGKPMVLHGASGVAEDVLHEAIEAGIAIVNIDSELRVAFASSLRESLASQPDEVDPRHIMKPVIAAIKDAAIQKLKACKTQNLIN